MFFLQKKNATRWNMPATNKRDESRGTAHDGHQTVVWYREPEKKN